MENYMGKQLALAAVLAVVSSSAAARWVAIGSSDDITFYADPATIKRTGTIVQIVTLFDSKTAREGAAKPYRSARGQQEYDCEKVRERRLASKDCNEFFLRGSSVWTRPFVGLRGHPAADNLRTQIDSVRLLLNPLRRVLFWGNAC
jgi:hypothetical protein